MLALDLEAAGGPFRVGGTVPVRIRVTNTGDRPVRVVGVVDGAETGQRYPHYLPLVELDGVVVARPGAAEDPLVGPLRPSDAVLLEPGAAFDPSSAELGFMPLSTFATFRPAAPGLHRWSLTLDTEAPDATAWLGRFGQDPLREAALALVAEVPRVRLTAALDVLVEG